MKKLIVSNKEFWLHILFWTCIFILPIVSAFSEDSNFKINIVIRLLISPIVFYFNYFLLVPFFLIPKKISRYILLSVGFLVTINLLWAFVVPERPFDVEIVRKFPDFPKPPPKRFDFIIPALVSFAFYIMGGVIPLLKNVYKVEKLNEEKESERRASELQFLKAQLNPHFIFNALNSIYSLVRAKSNDAPEAVLAISESMRYMLYESSQQSVPLTKEIEYLQNYISLQRLRFNTGESVKFNVIGNLENKKIEPLLLIPFVENAFKHGTNFKGETDIVIKIEVTEESLIFICENL